MSSNWLLILAAILTGEKMSLVRTFTVRSVAKISLPHLLYKKPSDMVPTHTMQPREVRFLSWEAGMSIDPV